MKDLSNVDEIIRLTGYDGDPILILSIGLDLERNYICFHTIKHILSSEIECYYYKLIPEGDAWKVTNQDITWEVEWENLMK